MRTAHYLLLDNLMKYYPLSTSILGLNVKDSLNWALQNGFVDEDNYKITEKGREYFMLHQYDVLNDNE